MVKVAFPTFVRLEAEETANAGAGGVPVVGYRTDHQGDGSLTVVTFLILVKHRLLGLASHEWRHRLVVPVYLVFALLGGLALLAAILSAAAALPAMRIVATALALLATLAAGLKLGYWRALDRTQLPADRGDAVGLPGRAVSVFERPHTEASYITREMAFVVARRHARRLRALALLLFTGVPLLAVYLTMHAGLEASWGWGAAAAAILAGSFVERWLFFAQARHMVTLYY